MLADTAPERLRRYNNIRVLRVRRTEALTPRMRRIVLGGEEIEGFGEGPNIKLLIPPQGLAEPEWPMKAPDGRPIWPEEPKRPAVRTYSVRSFDAAAGELTVDFVLHGKDGPAANWAARARPGDRIGVGGPGGRSLGAASRYLFAGDQSALPAIAWMLERLPSAASGTAFIEIAGPEEEQPLSTRAAVDVVWLHRNGAESGRSGLLERAVRAEPWIGNDDIFVWVAGESSSVRAIRAYLRDERRLDRRQFLVIGYWRYGMSEPDYKKAYNNDRDEDYFLGALT